MTSINLAPSTVDLARAHAAQTGVDTDDWITSAITERSAKLRRLAESCLDEDHERLHPALFDDAGFPSPAPATRTGG